MDLMEVLIKKYTINLIYTIVHSMSMPSRRCYRFIQGQKCRIFVLFIQIADVLNFTPIGGLVNGNMEEVDEMQFLS